MASLLRSVSHIFLGNVVGVLISIIFTPILVRVLSQTQYGLYAGVLAGFSIVTLISKGGLFDATRKSVAEYSGNPTKVSSAIFSASLLGIVYSIFSIGIIFLSLNLEIVPSQYTPYVRILMGAILFGNVFAIVRGTLFGLQQESVGEALRITRRLVYMSGGLLLIYLGYDVLGLFIAYAFSFLILSIIGCVVIRDYLPHGLSDVNNFTTYSREIASFGGYQLIGGLSAMLLYRTDILLVEHFKGGVSTALYQSALVPAEMIWFIPSAIQMAFLQHTASLWGSDEVGEINENLQTGIKYAVLSLTLFGGGLLVLAKPFLTVYFGPDYVGATTTLQILIIGAFFFGIIRVVVPVLQATGWIRYTELITVGALVINILLNVTLIPRYGIIGAGIGTGISYVAMFLGTIVLWKYSPFDIVPLKWTGKLVITQGIYVVLFLAIVRSVDVPSIISLLVFPPLGFVLFLVINTTAGYIYG